MGLEVVSNKGDVMFPNIFEDWLNINAKVYKDVLMTVVKPRMDKVAAGRHYIFQQDDVPAYTIHKTQAWCRENLIFFWEKDVCPSSLPDWSYLDYLVWCVAKMVANCPAHNKKEVLITAIKEIFADIPREHATKACSWSQSCLEKFVADNCDLIE